MSTLTMDEFLNHKRLTDFAQFAVPDGHDLWPEIERAARRSVAAMPTSRPSILSLGFSGAWTAVGILLIAATFAVLGFGLAVLVLSNDEMSVPASQPEATATPATSAPTLSGTAVPTVAATRPSAIRDIERTALTTLFDATGGEDWNTSDGWLGDSPLDQWQRVITDEDGKVTDLDLGSNQLSGEIPAELGNLARLKLLYLSDNELTGTLPRGLTRLSGLESFRFHNNAGLCAPIDEEFQTWLHGIAEVYGSSCAPEDSLEDREVLVELYDAMDGENWTNNTNWLTERPVRQWYGVMSDASGRVTGLVLDWNGLTGEIPAALGGLSDLENLVLHSNGLTGEIPAVLGSLPNLEILTLNSNRLTGEIPTELGSLSNLEILALSSNRLTGEIPAELSSLSNLKTLVIDSNQLTGEIPKELGSLSNLELLALSSNRLTGQIPTELSKLSNLELLSLAINQLTGEIPRELGSLSNLTRLDLRGNYLIGKIPEELGNLSNLDMLLLFQNDLSGCIPAKLREVQNNDLGFPDMPPFCQVAVR